MALALRRAATTGSGGVSESSSKAGGRAPHVSAKDVIAAACRPMHFDFIIDNTTISQTFRRPEIPQDGLLCALGARSVLSAGPPGRFQRACQPAGGWRLAALDVKVDRTAPKLTWVLSSSDCRTLLIVCRPRGVIDVLG